MILTTHALTGVVIGKTFNDPILIIFFSLTIHFLMDAFRHGEYFDDRTAKIKNTAWKVGLDLAITFVIIIIFINLKNYNPETIRNISLGIFFSLIPDGLTLLFWKYNFKSLKKIKEFHSWAHRYPKFPKYSPERQWTVRNALNDILISALAILILSFF